MDPHRRTPMLVPQPNSRRNSPGRPSLLERIRRRFWTSKQQEEPEVPWFLDGVTVLSPEGSAEVLDEIRNGSPLTPERAAMFERIRVLREVHARSELDDCGGPVDPYRRTPMLSPEGSREVEEEMSNPAADTPGRRALFERVEVRAAMRRRMEEADCPMQKS